ncbi:MAG: TonB-dependent receptor [Hyphomonadaceae bacterium]|nr:TonB-dependent receptor [Hyphomonadaceae bacterium]
MTSQRKSIGLLLGVAGAALALATPARAQEQQDANAPTASDEVVVLGTITYRNRTEAVAPTLEYGLDYFQRFEPLTAGDALKRVPSVAFLSDVIEADGVRLRGLDPAYTQILINGEQVPGSGSSSGAFGNGAEQSFFVDRIPAELIERVEIVRSASANRSGDALAGAINIVLRDSQSLEGGFVRLGAQRWDDGKVGGLLGGVYGGQVGPGRALIGLNFQDRHNPKRKRSLRFEEPGGAFVNTEIQHDVRDGQDYSANGSYEVDMFGGELKLDGFYVRTDRFENEDSIEFNSRVYTNAALLTTNDNNADIEQESYSLNGAYAIDVLGGEFRVKLGYANFENRSFEFEDETEYLRDAVIFPEADRYTGDAFIERTTDEEAKVKFEYEFQLGETTAVETGLHLENKKRDFLLTERPRQRTGSGGIANLPAGFISTTARPNIFLPAIGPYTPGPGGRNQIERDRIDPYIQVTGRTGAFAWEAGVRLETTEINIRDFTVAGAGTRESDYEFWLPSASVRWDLTDEYRITASAARTVRNPSFNFLSPALLLAELGDNDFVGNPALEPETAIGGDLGLERRIGRTGIAGVNVFYRDVTDVIELFSRGTVGSAGPGTFVYSARNTGDGEVYGVEFDLSAPLTIVGLENTGVFLNYSLLDSTIDDEFGERTFNSQAEYVFNVGFIHDLPGLGAAFGTTYRKQGDAFSRVVGEEVTTEYGADLEVFVEKRLGERFTIRFVGSNLLNAEKNEAFNKFTTVADQRSRSFDEFELETEDAGSVYQIVGRLAF